jgi:arabinogalactan endo-1,4-beta-galactosidase
MFTKSTPLPVLLIAILAFAPTLFAAPTTEPFHRTGPFLLGADVSWVQEDEANGTTYFDRDQKKDVFEILKDHGFNAIRLRVFVNPASPIGYAKTSKEAFCDLGHTLVVAKRAHDAGMTLLIDFHYSDTWADPGKQAKPAAWEKLDLPELKQAVYDHTFEVLTALKKQGTPPRMVQIGNEINHGMLWPAGEAKDHFDQFAELLKSGIAAARAVDPSMQIVLHSATGRDNQVTRAWLDNLISRGMQFDIIGLSCNDTGSPENWKKNFDDLAIRYSQYGLIAAEYSYHKRELNDAVFHAPDHRGIGTFIWEPTRHHEAIFDPHDKGEESTVGSAGHRPRTGRFDTNELIDLYPEMAKGFESQH